jgi:hypothetical protein
MQLKEWRWALALLACLLMIANGIYQTRSPRRFRLDHGRLKVAAAIASSVLLGYPCAIAGAFISVEVTRQGGVGLAIAIILFLAILGLPFLAFCVFIALMDTKTIFTRSMFFYGSFAGIGGFVAAAGWGIWGGNASRLLSWRLPLAALCIAIITGLLAFGAEITSWRWADIHPQFQKRYVAANAILALVTPAAVWLAIGAID